MDNFISSKTPKAKRKVKFLSILLSITVGIILIAFAVSVLLGFVFIGVKQPAQRVAIQSSVCTTDDVLKKLNGYLSDITNKGDQSKAKEAIDYVKAQSNYSSDATCVEALTRFYYMNRDPDNFAIQIDELEKLVGNGQYPSNKFDGLTSLNSKVADFEGLTGRSR